MLFRSVSQSRYPKRYPAWVSRLGSDWCGEFRDREWDYTLPLPTFQVDAVGRSVEHEFDGNVVVPVMKRRGRPKK